MSAMNFARQAFSREKPHSSITDWVDILTSRSYQEEAYDGIPELVDSINLQPTGPAEASRAIRKKMKHGNPHHQYRAIVILNALVANGGHKFQTTFADGYLTDAIKTLATDTSTDPKVRKKMMSILAAWQMQFKSDPAMSLVAGLYKQCKPRPAKEKEREQEEMLSSLGIPPADEERMKKAKEKKKENQDRERAKKAEEERRRNGKVRRARFDFEKEKPLLLTAIASATQVSNNLVNALTLVNLESDDVKSNVRVQEYLSKAKQFRKPIVRYIQLVEDEELIGTLIETNERIIAAMEMYDRMSNPNQPTTEEVTSGLAVTKISLPESEVSKLQEKQRAAVERAKGRSDSPDTGDVDESYVHPDLQDLSFGPLGADDGNLPPPLRPTSSSVDPSADDDSDPWQRRGSLSDFSDYESSDEETHNHRVARSEGRGFVNVSDNEDDGGLGGKGKGALVNLHPKDEDDPFADPFADDGVGS